MSKYPASYEMVSNVTESGIQYFFVSEGHADIIKVVQFSYVSLFQGRKVYNLGFGDYDPETDVVSHDLTSNNGDHYSVFHTVLSTIPEFFIAYSNAMIIVWGSDSTREFKEDCKLNCRKRCKIDECKNSHRRINIYRNYIDKNYDVLDKEYVFFGGLLNNENKTVVERYQIGKKYDSILVQKKS